MGIPISSIFDDYSIGLILDSIKAISSAVKPYLVYSPSEDTYYYMSNVREPNYDRSYNKNIEK